MQGIDKKSMKYPLEKIEFTYRLPEAKYLTLVSQAMSDYAYYQWWVKGDKAKAEKILLARLTLGWHMTNNRVYPYFVWSGLHVQEAACYQLEQLYQKWDGHTPQAEKTDQYRESVETVIQFFEHKKKYLFDKFASPKRENLPEPGDIFNVVENDKDPCWRIQGIFSLGMLLNDPATFRERGDEKYTHKLLEMKMKEGSDEEKAAAKAASELTPEEFGNLGSKNEGY